MYDPTDPAGIYDDPHGEASSDHGQYPDQEDARETHTCDSCDRVIPRHEHKCEMCAGLRMTTEQAGPPSVQTTSTEREWLLGRIVIAVVPASIDTVATALGSAAFNLADTEAIMAGTEIDVTNAEVVDADIEPLSSFNGPPADALERGWESLETARVNEQEGRGYHLLQTAIEQTDWTADEAAPYIITEAGQTVTNRGALEDLQETIASSDEPYWVVPGVIDRCIERTITTTCQLACRGRCSKKTTHEFISCEDYQGKSVVGQPIWECTKCGASRHGPVPGAKTN
jgi:hypothetical protein